jgi:hypothetical protein
MKITKISIKTIALIAYSLLFATSLFAQWEIFPPDSGNCRLDPDLGVCAFEGERCMDGAYHCGHCSSITMPFGVPDCVCN